MAVEALEGEIYYGDVYTGEAMIDDTCYVDETENSSISSNVILWITIVVCAIIGVTLGIILGRRSAMK